MNLRAYGGSLDIKATRISSWDEGAQSVDHNVEDGRAYISAISEVVLNPDETCEGAAKSNMGQARMDIEDAEILYLGYAEAESYGISWKLRGICKTKSNRHMYEGYGVWGNMINSTVNGCYFGHYGYAHRNALLSGNKIRNSIGYGFDPHDDSNNITISGNEVSYNGHHGIIFSKYCLNVDVRENHVHHNRGVGIFAHYLSDNSYMANNRIHANEDSGIAFLESSEAIVYNNSVVENKGGGVRLSVGARDNLIIGNTFESNEGFDLYTYEGNDETVGVENGSPTRNVVYGNTFWGNDRGGRIDDAVDTQFLSNAVNDWGSLEMRDSSNTLVLGNTFPADMVHVCTGSCVNFASDIVVAPEEVCVDAAEVHPWNDTLDNVVGTTQAPCSHSSLPTSSPSLPVAYTLVPTTVGSSAPTAAPTAAPTDAGAERVVVETSDDDGTVPDRQLSGGVSHILTRAVTLCLSAFPLRSSTYFYERSRR